MDMLESKRPDSTRSVVSGASNNSVMNRMRRKSKMLTNMISPKNLLLQSAQVPSPSNTDYQDAPLLLTDLDFFE